MYVYTYTHTYIYVVGVGADIEAPNSQQQTLLYLAVIREQAKACLFLIESGADYRKKSVYIASHLHVLCCSLRVICVCTYGTVDLHEGV